MTWHQWIKKAIIKLNIINNKSAIFDAEILLQKAIGISRSKIIAYCDTLLTNRQNKILEQLLSRRVKGEPIAYITGQKEFWSLNLNISSYTFIPRSDTECIITNALKLNLPKYSKILDLGTGSGAIALALAKEKPYWNITGIDFYYHLIRIAQNNAINLNLYNTLFFKSHWFKSIKKQYYNLIISNPPYIGLNDPHLKKGDLRFEPRSALISGNNGLRDLEIICKKSKSYLVPGGWLILEHSWFQGFEIRKFLYNNGFYKITTTRDYGNKDRITQGKI